MPGVFGRLEPFAKMNLKPEQLKEYKKILSETIAEVAEKQQDLINLLSFLSTIKGEHQLQLTRSTNSARKRRGKMKIQSMNQKQYDYENEQLNAEQALGLMWYKIHDLQEMERDDF